MAHPTPRNHHTTRITLASGKQIDVVDFTEARPLPARRQHVALACCPACGHDRVQPVTWSEVGDTEWRVELRCPDCETRREAVFGQDELDEFDVALDDGTRSVAADLDLLARANMADDIDRFTFALQAGHIHPDDF